MPKNEKLTLPKGTKVPNHIAIVLDGNRRWARARGLKPSDGHKAGYVATKKVTKACRDFGVHTLTIWGFSTENWERSEEETKNIMRLVRKFLGDFEKECHKEKIRFVHLGRKDRFPKDIVEWIVKLEKTTCRYKKYNLNVALDYGGRDEIIRAVRKIVKTKIPERRITEKLFASYLDTADQPYPYPDLFIRPSGEQRTSGLMPWQMTYAEYYWEADHLPDITPKKLREIILDFSRRRRRFGGNDAERHLKFKPEITANIELDWWRLAKIPEDKTFGQYAYEHVKELYGLSTSHAKDAAKHLTSAIILGEKSEWKRATLSMARFYKLVKNELKLAFEPSLVASLDIKLLQNDSKKGVSAGEYEDDARKYLAEVYRISDFQAKKAAHLRTLAAGERRLAELGEGEYHWDRARDYLEKYYEALKDRVA